MAEPFLGEVRMMSFVFAPQGWALCNGQLLPINQNQGLFSLFGTTYGGNGQTNFALPDLRGRVPIHQGSGHAMGERAGEQAHTLNISEMPAHNHLVRTSSDATTRSSNPTNRYPTNTSPNNVYAPPNAGLVTFNPAMVSSVGGSQAHLNMQPFLTISFCVALQGIFPSQN